MPQNRFAICGCLLNLYFFDRRKKCMQYHGQGVNQDGVVHTQIKIHLALIAKFVIHVEQNMHEF